MKQSKGYIHIVLVFAIAFIAATLVGAAWWYSNESEQQDALANLSNQIGNAGAITNFDECAAAGYPVMESYPRQCAANGQTFTEVITNTNQLLGGDADEHGCIGSAGYSWCEEKQKCLRTWEESCGTSTNASAGGEELLDLSTTAVSSTDEWATYTNQEIDISFSYPKKWGEPKTQLEDLSQNGEGKSVQIDFPAQRATSFGGLLQLQYSSTDFGPGREIWYGEAFSGVAVKKSFDTVCSWSKDDFFLSPIDQCSVAIKDSHQTAMFISRIDALGGEEVLDFVKTFAFTTDNTEYPAATLSLFLPELTRGSVSTFDTENLATLVNNIDAKNLDAISNNHLEVFDKILSSFTFTD